jgi:hypothetical protein
VSSDLTPAIFGFLGTAVGAVSTTFGSAWVESNKFRRSRAADDAAERRKFRIDTLVEVDAAMQGLYESAHKLFLMHSQPASQERLEAILRTGEDATKVAVYTARLPEGDVRQLCIDASTRLGNAAADMNCATATWEAAIAIRAEALEAIGTSLRDLHAS